MALLATANETLPGLFLISQMNSMFFEQWVSKLVLKYLKMSHFEYLPYLTHPN